MICVCVPEVHGNLINPQANSHITSTALKTQKNVLRNDIMVGAGWGGKILLEGLNNAKWS